MFTVSRLVLSAVIIRIEMTTFCPAAGSKTSVCFCVSSLMKAPWISPPVFCGRVSRMQRTWLVGFVCSTSTLAARFVCTHTHTE